jgi:hypothetical protein
VGNDAGKNLNMTLQGTIRGGMVVLDEAIQVPDGTKVSVYVPSPVHQKALSVEEEAARSRAALAELLALPNENPGDTFSGADHDKVLYGDGE